MLSLHVHGFKSSTEYMDGHNHILCGSTGFNTPAGYAHTHYYRGVTSVDDQHVHYYQGITGPPIPLTNGGHTHQYYGHTSVNHGHSHEFNAQTLREDVGHVFG